ncbi:hypothetical protein BLAT2472_100193 [Burkholderia latens]
MGFGRLFVQHGGQPVIKDRWWDAAGRRSLNSSQRRWRTRKSFVVVKPQVVKRFTA